MEACSVTITGTLAYDPQLGKTQSGDPKLTMTLKVQTRANRTRWIKVRARTAGRPFRRVLPPGRPRHRPRR